MAARKPIESVDMVVGGVGTRVGMGKGGVEGVAVRASKGLEMRAGNRKPGELCEMFVANEKDS